MKVTRGKISITLPIGWYAQSIQNNPSLLLMCYSPEEQNDSFRESISITAGLVENNGGLDEYIDELKMNLLSYMENCQVQESEKNYMIATGTINNVTVKEYFKFIKKGKYVYCITAAARPETYEAWEATFMQILKSIKIK